MCYIPDNCPLDLYSCSLRGMDRHSPGLFSESPLHKLHCRCPTPPKISIFRQLKNLSQKLDLLIGCLYIEQGNKCTYLDTDAYCRWKILQRRRNSPFLRRRARCRTYSATGPRRHRSHYSRTTETSYRTLHPLQSKVLYFLTV